MKEKEKIENLKDSAYKKAVDKLKNAANTNEKFYALGDIALASLNVGKYEDARNYANELKELIPKYRKDWNYGNSIQDVNIVLGRLALLENRVNEAKSHLLEAGKSPGSPQMLSFGPNLSLARDFLERGEKEVVLEYFELCRKFWKNEKGYLNKWADEVRNGNIPDFGGNLFY